MVRGLILVFAAIAFLSAPASAAKMTEKEKCLKDVLDVQEGQAAGDSPGIGAKTQAEVDQLIEIAKHLCEQGNFKYAETLLTRIRTKTASE